MGLVIKRGSAFAALRLVISAEFAALLRVLTGDRGSANGLTIQ